MKSPQPRPWHRASPGRLARPPVYFGLATALLIGAVLGACSLAVDFADCRDDADCGTLSGAQWRCVDSRCVDPSTTDTGTATTTATTTQPPTTTEASTTGASDDSSEPSTSTDPVTATGETTTGTGPGTGTGTDTGADCTLHSECEAELGLNQMCIAGACVGVLSGECRDFVWPSQGSHDKVVLLGSIIPTSPPYDSITVPLKNGVQLAIEDFNRTTDLPGGYAIAWLTCEDSGSSDVAITAARHLTEVLGAPAIVGPVFSEQVIAVAKTITVPAGTFLMTPSAASKAITTLEDDDLVWRPISSEVFQANALADRVLTLVPAADRVVLLSKDDAYGKGLKTDVSKRLSEQLGAAFKAYEYADPVSGTPDDIAMNHAKILGYAWGSKSNHPDTFVIAGTSEVADFVSGIMLRRSAEDPMSPAPRFIVSDAGVPSMEGIVLAAPSDPDKVALIANLEGVAPDLPDSQNFASFNERYKSRFNGAEATPASALAYDATLVTLFAMAGVPQGDPITGAAIAGNIGRLVDPEGLAVSFDDVEGENLSFITAARAALVSGGAVDLRGTSGALNFDLTVGEVRTDVLGWALSPEQGMPTSPVLAPRRVYKLAPAPAEDGDWMDLP